MIFYVVKDLQKFRRCQALLRLKLQERKILEENTEGHYSSDEVRRNVYIYCTLRFFFYDQCKI